MVGGAERRLAKVKGAIALEQGNRNDEMPSHQGREALVANSARRASGEQSSAEHSCAEIGFRRQAGAEAFHDDLGVRRSTTEAAVGLRYGDREPSEVGHPTPGLSRRRRRRALPGIVVSDETPDGVPEKALVFGQTKVHRPAL